MTPCKRLTLLSCLTVWAFFLGSRGAIAANNPMNCNRCTDPTLQDARAVPGQWDAVS